MKCAVCGAENKVEKYCLFCESYIIREPLVSKADVENYKEAAKKTKLFLSSSEEFEISNKTLAKYNGEAEWVVIPAEVEVIAGQCFKPRSAMRAVFIPSSVQSIGKETKESDDEDNNGAFLFCKNLERVVFSSDSNLENIGNYSFYGCGKLKRVEGYPKSVRRVRIHAFAGCNLDEKSRRQIKENTINLDKQWDG